MIQTTDGNQWDYAERHGVGHMSIRAVAKLAGIDHKSLFKGGGIKSQKLVKKLAAQGFSGGGLWATDGIPAHEVVVVLEYYAYDSRVKSESARRWLLTLSAKTINDWILAQCGRSTLSTRKQELNQKIKEEPQRIQLRGESKQAHSFWREQGEACKATERDFRMQNACINGEAFGIKGTNGYPTINKAIEAKVGGKLAPGQSPRDWMNPQRLSHVITVLGGSANAIAKSSNKTRATFNRATDQARKLALLLCSGDFFDDSQAGALPAGSTPATNFVPNSPKTHVRADKQGNLLELLS